MSSWTVRNWLLVGAFVPLTTGIESSAGGFVFWISNNHLTAQPGEYWGRFIPAKEYPNMPDFAAYDSQTTSSVTQLDRKGYEYGLKSACPRACRCWLRTMPSLACSEC